MVLAISRGGVTNGRFSQEQSLEWGPPKEIPNIEIYTFKSNYVYVFSVYVYVHHMGFMLLQRLEEGVQSHGTGVRYN